MQFQSILKRVIPFAIALLLGLLVAGLLRQESIPGPNTVTVSEPKRSSLPVAPQGSGSSGPGDRGIAPGETFSRETPCAGTCGLKIVSKPRPNYTDLARQNNTQGSVTLRITFLASGEIGGISPVQGLPDGLTEQAIAAARKIRFQPATKDGVPYSKTMTVQYSFTIY